MQKHNMQNYVFSCVCVCKVHQKIQLTMLRNTPKNHYVLIAMITCWIFIWGWEEEGIIFIVLKFL